MVNSEFFKSALKNIGQTGNDAAKFLEIDPSAWCRILKGERQMSALEARRAAKFLKLPIDKIIDALDC